jgi:carboxypeptidase Q
VKTTYWRLATALSFVFTAFAGPARAQDGPDPAAMGRIRDEGFNRSKVMEISSWIEDVYGPRLTGSPNVKKAGDWVIQSMRSWGISNPHYEAWGPFGHGWVNEGFTAQVVAPQFYPIIAYATPWSFGTSGTVAGEVVLGVKIDSAPDFAKYHGKLRGRWIMADEPRAVPPHFTGDACRFDEAQLQAAVTAQRETKCNTPADSQLARFAAAGTGGRAGRGGPPAAGAPAAAGRGGRGGGGRGGAGGFQQELTDFYVAEGVLGILHSGAGTYSDGAFGVQGGRGPSEIPKTGIANIMLMADHYGRIYRTAEKGIPVKVEINARNVFTPDTGSFNIVGEIPGADARLKDEVVMLGAHFDSWAAGTGATDNGAGSAVMLEALRILKTLNLPMKRTVRLALWTGEEQGLLGSRAYVRQHFGYVDSLGQHFTPEWGKVAGYFNVDNGSGAIRGVYAEHNEAVVPIFKAWLEPFRDLGASTVTLAPTTGTDHQSFDGVGMPGFQFIQDELDYSTHTHHTNMDLYERLVPHDLMQDAVIVAAFVYNTANRTEKLPRKPEPTTGGARRGGL